MTAASAAGATSLAVLCHFGLMNVCPIASTALLPYCLPPEAKMDASTLELIGQCHA